MGGLQSLVEFNERLGQVEDPFLSEVQACDLAEAANFGIAWGGLESCHCATSSSFERKHLLFAAELLLNAEVASVSDNAIGLLELNIKLGTCERKLSERVL